MYVLYGPGPARYLRSGLIPARQVVTLFLFFFFVEEFYLSVPENYHYLNQSGCMEDKTISDQESFREVIVSYSLVFPVKSDPQEASGFVSVSDFLKNKNKGDYICATVGSSV